MPFVIQFDPGKDAAWLARGCGRGHGGWDPRPVLLVCRFAVPTPDAASFLPRARRALELLTAAAGCLGGELGRAVDEPDRWVLTVRFASVDAYRRALSPFAVREHVVPLLSEALADEPSTFETLLEARAGEAEEHPSLLV
jgi:quinol monooxygenase YgiN